MKRLLVSLVALLAALSLVAGCSQAAPAPAPTKAAEPAKAAAPQATTAPAAKPTAAAAPKVNFPEKGKSVTIIVPFTAGGGTDVGARLLASAVEKELGTSVEVVNKTGAGSQVGITELVRSKPDGYTIAATNLPTTQTLYMDPERKAVFSRKDFAPLAVTVLDPGVIVVGKNSPYKTLKELIDAAKAKPEQVKASTTGIMTGPHLSILDTQKVTGAKFAIVHFEGASQGTTALLGGHIDAQFGYVGDLLSQIKSGELRALAVLDKQPSPYIPDVKTAESQGYALTAYNTRGWAAPGGTPKEVVDVLSNAIKRAATTPEMKKKMDEMGLASSFMDAAQFSAFWDKNDADLKPLVEQAKQK